MLLSIDQYNIHTRASSFEGSNFEGQYFLFFFKIFWNLCCWCTCTCLLVLHTIYYGQNDWSARACTCVIIWLGNSKITITFFFYQWCKHGYHTVGIWYECLLNDITCVCMYVHCFSFMLWYWNGHKFLIKDEKMTFLQ